MICSQAYRFSPSVNNLKDFLDDVVEDEAEEDNLDAENKMVPSIDVAEELAYQVEILLHIHIFHFTNHALHLYRSEVSSDHKPSGGRDLEGNLKKI